jgi:hypothetical protein
VADDQPTGSAPPGSFAETVLFMAVLVGLAGIAVALVSVSAPDGVKFVLAAILAMLTAVCFGLFVIVRR